MNRCCQGGKMLDPCNQLSMGEKAHFLQVNMSLGGNSGSK